MRGGQHSSNSRERTKAKALIFTFSIPMGEDLPFPLPSNPLSHSHFACDYDLESFIFPPLFLSFFLSLSIPSSLSNCFVSIHLRVLHHDQQLTYDASPHSFQKLKTSNKLFFIFSNPPLLKKKRSCHSLTLNIYKLVYVINNKI